MAKLLTFLACIPFLTECSVRSYDLAGVSWAGPYPRVLTVGLDPDADVPWQAATLNAVEQWSAATRGALVFTVIQSRTADIEITLDDAYAVCDPGVMGCTELRFNAARELEWAGIWVNVLDFDWHTGYPFGFQEPDLASTDSIVIHELGHALGLNHSSEQMSFMYRYLGGFDELQPDDIAGILAVYPAMLPKQRPIIKPWIKPKPVLPVAERKRRAA